MTGSGGRWGKDGTEENCRAVDVGKYIVLESGLGGNEQKM